MILACSSQGILALENQYLYGYVEIGEATTLVLINPHDLSAPAFRYSYPLPPEWHLGRSRTTANPYTKDIWVAAELNRGPSEYMIQIANITTGFTKEFKLKSSDSRGEAFRWSSDGDKLAMIAGIDDIQADLYVYSLSEDTLVNLSKDNHMQINLSWSADNSKVATVSVVCEPAGTCEKQYSGLIDVYDIKSQARIYQLDLSSYTVSGNSACDLLFSQDAIAFTSYCYDQNIGYAMLPSDVYVWNLEANRVDQVTDFGETALRTKSGLYAIYDYAWVDAESLLVGADYHFINFDPQDGHQLLDYDLNGETQVISKELGAGFSLNPVTNEIILRTRSPEFIITPELNNPPIQSLITQSSTLQEITKSITFSDIKVLDNIASLIWSPDGNVAYGLVLNKPGDYPVPTGDVIFFDAATHETLSLTVTSDKEGLQIIPVGWVPAIPAK